MSEGNFLTKNFCGSDKYDVTICFDSRVVEAHGITAWQPTAAQRKQPIHQPVAAAQPDQPDQPNQPVAAAQSNQPDQFVGAQPD